MIDFKNTVLIMTSNLGAREISKGGSLGFHDGKQQSSYDVMQAKVRDEIERAFNPEFSQSGGRNDRLPYARP